MEHWNVSIADILGEHGASVLVSGELPLDRLVVGDEEFPFRAPAAVSVELTNTGAGFVAMGTVTAPVTAVCVRCLRTFDMDIVGEVEGFYVEHGHEEGLPEEQEVEFVSADSTVDIMPALMEALVVAAPFAPLHAEDCAGICPECGADLNGGSCACGQAPAADHPFSTLASLLPELTDRDPEDSAR
jgi:uncharacterized protein